MAGDGILPDMAFIPNTRHFIIVCPASTKKPFKRFRRSHPTLTNQEAMSMFKLNHGHSRYIGLNL